MRNQYGEHQTGRRAKGTFSFGQEAARALEDMRSKAVEIKETVVEAGKKTAAKIDAQREPSARAIENTAQGLRKGAETVSSTMTSAARATADKLQDTADYIRGNDVKAMVEDVMDSVRRNPGWSLAMVAVAGFLVGRAFGRTWR